MKKLSIAFLLFSGSCLFYSCNGNNTSSESSTSDSTSTTATDTLGTHMDTMTNTTGTGMVDEKAKDFAADAATAGMLEVELGNLAQQKATSKSVRNFGKMMVDDHTKTNDNLKTIATQKNIDLPPAITDEQRKDIDKLSKKTGADFDKAYIDMMVDDHKKNIAAFKKAQGDVSDNDIKNFITNTLPTLQKHLDAIQAIKAKM